ncbi:MAG: excinuclease ABC subunit UvrA [Verrucomicrobia bacterium]|nr:excinuclease ABC subunit UvrA [Verrucomicrobiota bacterium]
MSESNSSSVIRLRGVRHNNLKNFDLDLPLGRLIAVTGLSGSGKSSLAFDTLYAEGQRRYIETFSPYARQFFDRMDKPQVDRIDGIPPAIAIEQRNAVRTTRSTIGTMTEICDHMKILWTHIAQLHCRACGQPVTKDSPQQIWKKLVAAEVTRRNVSGATISKSPPPHVGGYVGKEVLITFDLPLSEKLSLDESLALVSKQGYQRLLLNDEVVRLDEALSRITPHASRVASLTIIQDRLKLSPPARARFVEACEQAYHFGKGKLAIRILENSQPSTLNPQLFSNRLHCASCDIEYAEPSPALFSFNHPLGACPACKGFGRIISIDYDLAIPDRSLTLAQGAVKPWRSGTGAECQSDLKKFCRIRRVSMDVPFNKLSAEHQHWVVEGDKDYGIDDDHRWPRLWYGVKGYFRWLETKSYKMHVRVLLSRYRAYTKCPDCDGARLKPDALLYLLSMARGQDRCGNLSKPLIRPADTLSPSDGERDGVRGAPETNQTRRLTLADFYALPIRDAQALIDELTKSRLTRHASRSLPTDPIFHALNEVRARLAYLNEVGLGYLTLDRPTRTLSGGETERVNLTTCLGTRLVNTLFVLDEPSVGLHPRDTDRLVRILEKLRDTGNTVVVVEHEASVMRAADQIVDLGPGHGATGGEVVFQGSYKEILKSKNSLTGKYLSRRKQIEIPPRRPVAADVSRLTSKPKRVQSRLTSAATLTITNATRHNLQNLSVEIPLNRFVCVTGVSGSGKSTLIREVLFPALQESLKSQIPSVKSATVKASDRIEDLPSPGSGAASEDDATRNTHHVSRITGAEHLSRVVMVDQSILGKTPRSNPAVYIGAFDDIREVFAQSDVARQRGFNASAFSFNSSVGQCERCRGAGFEKIEMQFLSDVFIRCPDCNGRRYRSHILEVKVERQRSKDESGSNRSRRKQLSTLNPQLSSSSWSIADLLDATVDEVIDFLSGFAESRPAKRAQESLKLLQEVGLGYLRLGQPINTLSGGESQRLKLVRHLAEATSSPVAADVSRLISKSEIRNPESEVDQSRLTSAATLFLFDEPTTGLHFDDVRVLLQVFQRLVNAGHSLVVIEHNLDVIKSADWVIDLGPDAGDQGGKIVACGTPEQVVACRASHTGKALREIL